MNRDYNYGLKNSCGHQCPPIGKTEKGLESFGNIWRPYNAATFQLLNPGERVVFTEEEIIGNGVTHVANSTDIGLKAGGSYLIQYTTTVQAVVPPAQFRDVRFSLVFEDNTIVPGTTQSTTVEPSIEWNIVSSSTIINTKIDDRIIRLVAQVPPGVIIVANPVQLLAATITVVKIR